MFAEQINALELKEKEKLEEVIAIEELLKAKKNEIAVIRRAKKSLENAQESLNGQTDILE